MFGRLQRVVVIALLCAQGALAAEPVAPLRFGLTAVVLQDQAEFLSDWSAYLEANLAREVSFVQRGSYAEISELLSRDQLDLAWVCGAPYVRHETRWQLVAVPQFAGKPLYQSYLIVPASDSRTTSYGDLAGAVFAYSDPDSNSGYLVPQFEMLKLGLRAGSLFRKSFFTWAHQDTVLAVGVGLAEAGAVDGYIWETLKQIRPDLTDKTRVVAKSDWYGFPPIVARGSLSQEELGVVQNVLVAMADDTKGRQLLLRMNLDRFVRGDDSLFDGIRRINAYVDSKYAQGSKL